MTPAFYTFAKPFLHTVYLTFSTRMVLASHKKLAGQIESRHMEIFAIESRCSQWMRMLGAGGLEQSDNLQIAASLKSDGEDKLLMIKYWVFGLYHLLWRACLSSQTVVRQVPRDLELLSGDASSAGFPSGVDDRHWKVRPLPQARR